MRKRLKTRVIQSKPIKLIIRVLQKWQQDKCLEMGAALAYYSFFSLFPLLLVILSIFGFLLGANTDIYDQLLNFVQSSLPPEAYDIVVRTLLHLNQNSIEAGLLGFLLLVFTASNVFVVLQGFVNKIWQVRTRQHIHNNWIGSTLNFLRGRILAFGLVMGTALLKLIALLSRIAIEIIFNIIDNFNQSVNSINIDTLLLLEGLHKGAIFLLLSLALMVLFKILPSTKVAWSDVWLGGLITGGLIRLCQYLVRNSIIKIGSQFLSYGVVGSVMILLLWIYLICQLFLLGCEFTYVYAHFFGSRSQRKVDTL